MDESGIDEAECSRKVASGRRVAGTIGSYNLQLKWSRVLQETLLVPVLIYGSETMLWRERARSRIEVVQMYNLRGLLSIRRMDKVSNVRLREL